MTYSSFRSSVVYAISVSPLSISFHFGASGLNLIVAAIILWNTVYLERAITALREHGIQIEDESLVQPLAYWMGTHQLDRRLHMAGCGTAPKRRVQASHSILCSLKRMIRMP
jgi:hypothetical protein